VERLVDDGYAVTIIDDLNDFYAPELKIANLDEIGRAEAIRLYKVDICDFKRVSEIVGATRPEAVIHLAARAGVRPSLEQPLLYERVNVHGTTVLLEACRQFAVPRLVFASSSSVYGETNKIPFREDDSAARPISPYAATKLAGENICYTYSHLYGIKIACLRFFTVYGPRQRPDLAIRKFTEMIDCGEPIPVFGDGSSSRDYTYIDDIVQGVLAAIRLDCSYEVFNLGSAYPITLTTLIRTIEECLGKRAKLRRLPAQQGDVPLTYADISRAEKILAYAPLTGLSHGLERFVAWYRDQRSSSRSFRTAAVGNQATA
jgi:UDP-glucuronate 4-epimerase